MQPSSRISKKIATFVGEQPHTAAFFEPIVSPIIKYTYLSAYMHTGPSGVHAECQCYLKAAAARVRARGSTQVQPKGPKGACTGAPPYLFACNAATMLLCFSSADCPGVLLNDASTLEPHAFTCVRACVRARGVGGTAAAAAAAATVC